MLAKKRYSRASGKKISKYLRGSESTPKGLYAREVKCASRKMAKTP